MQVGYASRGVGSERGWGDSIVDLPDGEAVAARAYYSTNVLVAQGQNGTADLADYADDAGRKNGTQINTDKSG
jgi:hypothetical protein